jgi:hypothetical protein
MLSIVSITSFVTIASTSSLEKSEIGNVYRFSIGSEINQAVISDDTTDTDNSGAGAGAGAGVEDDIGDDNTS